MRRRAWFVGGALALALLCAAVCAWLFWPRNGESPAQIEFLIGMSQANLTEPWRITMNQDIERKASRHDNLRVIFTNASQEIQRQDNERHQDDIRRQIQDIRRLMGYGIDLLVVSPIDGEALMPVISEVFSQIPVIVLDRGVRGEEYTLFIGPNNYMIGQLAGAEVARLLGEGGGRVLEIQGVHGSPPVAERSKGFADALAGKRDVVPAAQLVGNWMQDQAEDRTKEYMVEHPGKIDVVFAQNDAMAYGARLAIDKLRVPGVRYVGVDGLDGPGGGREMVQKGLLDATFSCPTGGEQAIEYALRILKGEPALPRALILDPIRIAGSAQ
ncbi:MAG: substrate-binding domain-containing protein [Christensenellaceae bacterium]|nr:substrate-binding domain-containing protein [Christensenellaceae bacterium]MEA5069321.1 substrate-binding domain-containing protein [Christensenellaceae bacterium]